MTATEELEENMASQNDNDKEDFVKDTKPTPDDEALEDLNSPEQGNLLTI